MSIELAKAQNIHKTTEKEEIKREVLYLPKNVKINDIVNKAKQNIIITFVTRTAIP